MNLTIGKRITLGFAAAVVITVSLGIYSYMRLNVIETEANSVIRDALPGEALAGQLEATINVNQVRILEHVATTDKGKMAQAEAVMAKNVEAITNLLKEYEGTINGEADRQCLTAVTTARAEYLPVRKQVLELSAAGKKQEAQELMEAKFNGLFNTYKESAHALLLFNEKDGEAAGAEISASVAAGKTGVIIGLSVAVTVAAALAFVIIRSTSRALTRLASSLAAGAEQTTSAASQVSASSQSLAQGASEQAAALEETTSALTEMSSMTQKNAESAQEASGLSTAAKRSADQGNQAMQKMAAAIGEIEKSASDTAKIIKVIDEIAFQTNLLALNAAVEAARAGEAGKGFAVVAEEVRNLAQRSAEAAKNTASLIEGSVSSARNGVSITTEVATILQEITESSGKVNALVGEIAASSQEQSQGIGQVSKAVNEMDKVTQSNAAGAEESASAAEQLSSQAETMRQSIAELVALVTGATSAAMQAPPARARPVQAKQPVRQTAAASVTAKAKAKAEQAIPLDMGEEQAVGKGFGEFDQKAA